MSAPEEPYRCPYGAGPKVRYRSRREAEIAAWERLARRGCWLRTFRCGACHAWHLTHWLSRHTEGSTP